MPVAVRRSLNNAAAAAVNATTKGEYKSTERAPPAAPRSRPSRSASARNVSMAEESASEADGASSSSSALSDEEEDVKVTTPNKRGRPKAQTAANTNGNGRTKAARNGKAASAKTTPIKARKRASGPAGSDFNDEDAHGHIGDSPPPKKRGGGKKKSKEPVAYEVLPIEQHRDFRFEGPEHKRAERAEGFKGRLGYACLNTVLRSEDPPKFCSRNVRIKTIEEKGLDWVRDLARQNVRDIIPLLEWNAANNIHMMRLSSEIFPFASHEKYGYDISYAAEELAEAGAAARRLDQRLTMHPGQFCQLGTPKEPVLAASIRELEVHAKVLDLMGVGPEGVMILHGGGTFGDRDATLERIKTTIETRLPDFVRRRLVLENDELGYSAEELLPLCESLDPPVPLIFDFHHDLLRPSSLTPAEIIERAQRIFAIRGVRPKYHLSEPRPGAENIRERRAHSDRCVELPADLPADADLMLECKDKEQGVLHMYRIYQLYDVKHDVLRPPASDLTMATAGRRSKLDGSGGSTKGREKGKAKAKAKTKGSGSDNENEATGASEGDGEGAASTASASASPRKTERSFIERAIARGKAVAAKRGVAYSGPRSQEDLDDYKSSQSVRSSEEVRRDMERKAAWVRAELRAGRERMPFPGEEIEAEELGAAKRAGGANVPQPEPEAY